MYRVLLNGVPFIPDAVKDFRNQSFVSSLRILSERLISQSDCIYLSKSSLYKNERKNNMNNKKSNNGNKTNPRHDASNVADLILQRSCRTGTGSDSFFVGEKKKINTIIHIINLFIFN